MPNQFKPNPTLYQRLAVPRPRAAVEASIAAFDADVQAARERHGIAELLCVVGAVVAPSEEGATASTAIAVSSYGAASMTPVLALAAQRQAREMHMRIFDGMFAPGDGEDGDADDGEEQSK